MAQQIIYTPDPARGWRPWGILVPFLGMALFVLPHDLVALWLLHLHLFQRGVGPIGFTGFVTFLVLAFGTACLVILAWVRFVERRSLASIGLTRAKPLRTFLAGHLTGSVMVVAIVLGDWVCGAFGVGGYATAFQSPSDLGAIAVLLVCFAVQSSVEEIVFRGWMLSAIAAKFGVAAGVAVSTLMFALVHFDPHAPVLFGATAILFSLFACAWSLRTGNVWGIMGFHAGWNWLTAVGFELTVTGLDVHEPALLVKLIPVGPAVLTGGKYGPEASIFCVVVLAVGLAFELIRRRIAR